MKHTKLEGIEDQAARIGFFKQRMPPDYRQVRWHMTCSKCPAKIDAGWGTTMSAEGMAKFARGKHWDVGEGLRPLCPHCAHARDKAPRAKPEGQSFAAWEPPRTVIMDKLLIAAEEKAHRNKIAGAIERVLENGLAIASARADKRAAWKALTEAQKLQARQERCRKAQAYRAERLRQEKAAREAGAEALRKAQLLERCGTKEPITIQGIEIIFQESTAPQAVNNEAPQAPEENDMSSATRPTIAPAPKISHAVFQCLDAVFDGAKRLYRSGYTDQKVASECGTTEEIVAYLRKETFGDLAEDPRLSSMRDDIELLRMESAEAFAKLQKQLNEIASRLEQIAHS